MTRPDRYDEILTLGGLQIHGGPWTSLVPELPFGLAHGDVVTIWIDHVGALVNPVIRGRPRPPDG